MGWTHLMSGSARRAWLVCCLATITVTTSGWAADVAKPARSTATVPIKTAQLAGPAFPLYANEGELTTACEQGLSVAAAALKQLERRPADTSWLVAYDRFLGLVEDRSSAFDLMISVHPRKQIRDAAEACRLRWQGFVTSLFQNEKLFAAASKVRPRDAIDRHYLRTTLDAFVDGGVALPAGKRGRAKQINDELAELEQKFDATVRESTTKVGFTEAELAGVPPAVWKEAPRDVEGRVLLGLDMPTFVPVMELAGDAAVRERMWRAKYAEGGQANLDVLTRIVVLRNEYAGLFDLPSHAAFATRRRMAESPARVASFLDQVQAAVTEREKSELEELRLAKAQHLGVAPQGVRLARWDLAFYTERVRQSRYSVDQEAFRPYLPPEASLAVVMKLVESTMGVRYERVADAPVWHDDVRAYTVRDLASGKALGALYVDLYPREGKYNHAAVWPIRGSAPGRGRVSQAALVVNFNRQGLTLDEFDTLLHEFGHAVHVNLSATRYSGQSGTNVLLDFVEAPSQMLEDRAYDRKVLALFSQVCPNCKPMPDDLLAKAVAAHHYGKGVASARQRLYAAYDLALYSGGVVDPLALWLRMEGATPLGTVDGTLFPASFGHIASGYSAGYYAYLWSQVVALDMRTAFAGNTLDPQVGRRYRHSVIGQGGQRPPAELVREFLGRDFDTRAFYADLKK